MASILLIGEDELLLETRAAVLRSTGAEILCTNTSHAVETLSQRPFTVVMLCHSVAQHVCETLCGIIRKSWPETALLQVTYAYAWMDYEEYGVQVCSSEPEVLLAKAVELLGRRPVVSAAATQPQAAHAVRPA